jgi:Trypsin-like peptidase domain
MDVERVRAVRDDDPLSSWPHEKPIPIHRVEYEAVASAGQTVKSLANWDIFEGALLAVGFQSSSTEGPRLEGSAVMIAPGLAVTATHVFTEDYTDDELVSGRVAMVLLGIRSDQTADMWRVENIVYSPGDDMALLSVAPMSRIHSDWFISTFSLTTRTPKTGEVITVVGFREQERLRTTEADGSAHVSVGDVYIAQGEVGEVYAEGRDSFSMPYPTFEVKCGSLGAMSGGAILDGSGKLMGVISRGFTTDDGKGPTYATVINEVLNRPIEITWPPGVYDGKLAIHQIDASFIDIEGRERLRVVDGHLTFEVW